MKLLMILLCITNCAFASGYHHCRCARNYNHYNSETYRYGGIYNQTEHQQYMEYLQQNTVNQGAIK